MFSIFLAVIVTLLAAIPLLWMKTKSSRMIGALVALAIGCVGFGLSKAYIYPEYLSWQFEHEIKKQPLFALISQHYPVEFQDYLHKVQLDLRNNDNPDLVAAYSSQLVNTVFYKSLAHAPDDYVALYLKSTLDLYHYLNSQDPKAVMKLENGNNAIEYDLQTLYEKKDFQNRLTHLLDTKRYVIEASLQNPVAAPTAAVAEPLLKGVMTTLEQKFGEAEVRAVFTEAKTVSPHVGAAVIIDFYASVLGTGKENAGQIMRFIAGLKEASVHQVAEGRANKVY